MNLDDIKMYLFGSFLTSKNYNDIDILIVYKRKNICTNKILKLRKRIFSVVNKQGNFPVDITLLTEEEEKELSFIEIEKAIKIDLG